MFHKGNEKKNLPFSKVKSKHRESLTQVLRHRQLLIKEKAADYQKGYQSILELSDEQYEHYAQSLLFNLADYTQDLPETRNSYFSAPGGFLLHGLSRCSAALSLCRAYFVTDDGKPCKELSDAQQLWMYALFSAALLQGIGKLAVDFIVDMFDEQGEFIAPWQVFSGSLNSQGAKYYDYDFALPHQDALRHRSTVLLARQLMPDEGFLWLTTDKDVFASWLALLEERSRDAGTLGMLLDKADAMVINRYFSERSAKAYGEGGTKRKGTTFGIPQQHVDELKSGEIPAAGIEFIKWLSQGLATAKLMVNQSPLFMVPGGLLMSPDIFKLFASGHSQFGNWQKVQSSFLNLQLHSVGSDGGATQRFSQQKSGQVHSGVVLSAVGVVLPESVKTVEISTGVIKNVSSEALLSSKIGSKNFSSVAQSQGPMQALNQSGNWQTPGSMTQHKANADPTKRGF